MRFINILAAASALFAGAQAKCHYRGMVCEWSGEGPFCGTTRARIGDHDREGRVLEAWTLGLSLYTQCRVLGDLSTSCCEDYGTKCVTGYKRLWCHKKGFLGFDEYDLDEEM